MKNMCLLFSLLLASCVCFAKSNDLDLTTIKKFDISRFMGKWYEVARFDHSFERGMEFTKVTYSLNSDGTVTVINSGIKDGKNKVAKGKAKTTTQSGLLRVSFFGPFYSDYRILMLSPDYRYALIGSGSNKYLWILSRTPQIPELDKWSIIREAQKRGYDTDKLIWVNQ